MPKTKKKFNWEVFDEDGNFVDILTMSRNDAKDYHKKFPHYKINEIGYTDDD